MLDRSIPTVLREILDGIGGGRRVDRSSPRTETKVRLCLKREMCSLH